MPQGKPIEVIPNPDPSAITSAAIEKTVNAASEVINARLDGVIKNIEKFQEDMVRVPTTVDRAILSLRELQETRFLAVEHDLSGVHKQVDSQGMAIREQVAHLRSLGHAEIQKLTEVTTERFLGVAAQFSERDTRTDQRAGDTKLAVDAAFAAAKEATAKIEAGFTKQIDGMSAIIDTKTGNLNMGISDLKDRLTAMEARTQGISGANTDNRNSQMDVRSLVLGVVGVAIALGALVISFALFLRHY